MVTDVKKLFDLPYGYVFAGGKVTPHQRESSVAIRLSARNNEPLKLDEWKSVRRHTINIPQIHKRCTEYCNTSPWDFQHFVSQSFPLLPTHSSCRSVYFHLMTLRHTPQSVGLLWTRDRPVAETSDNKKHCTRDKHLCHRWDSNPRSQPV
jgi:hypothetical protein